MIVVVDIGSIIDQQLNHVNMPLPWSQHQHSLTLTTQQQQYGTQQQKNESYVDEKLFIHANKVEKEIKTGKMKR